MYQVSYDFRQTADTRVTQQSVSGSRGQLDGQRTQIGPYTDHDRRVGGCVLVVDLCMFEFAGKHRGQYPGAGRASADK